MPKVTLSLDNGLDPDVTPGVLETLARHGLKSTLFVIGEKAATPEGRALMERAHAEGHWIGNHTYTHSIPLGEDTDPEAPRRASARGTRPSRAAPRSRDCPCAPPSASEDRRQALPCSVI